MPEMDVGKYFETLKARNIRITLAGDKLRVESNLTQPLTDEDRATIRAHREQIINLLQGDTQPGSAPPYPNSEGLSKCSYCARYQTDHCAVGHHPGATALLRRCAEFRFDPGKWEARPPDMKVVRLDDALQSYTLATIKKSATHGELTATWEKQSPFWKRRLDPTAWKQVEAVYKERLKALTPSRKWA